MPAGPHKGPKGTRRNRTARKITKVAESENLSQHKNVLTYQRPHVKDQKENEGTEQQRKEQQTQKTKYFLTQKRAHMPVGQNQGPKGQRSNRAARTITKVTEL